MRVIARNAFVNAGDQPSPSPSFDKPHNRDHQGAQPDQETLQHLVEDRRVEAAERDIGGYSQRRDPDTDMDVPAEHDLDHQRHGMLMPDISTVMNANEMPLSSRVASP